MPTFIPQPGQVAEIDLRDLTDHPLLTGIPVWEREAPEFSALLESIRERGQDVDLIVDTEFRLVDGRNRRNALRVLGRPARCRFVSAADAASIIVSSLVNRRHLTRGALAYLVAPLFDGVLAESRRRRTSNLLRDSENRRNFASGETSMIALDPALSAGSMKNAEDVATHLGIGLRLYEQAIRLRRMFEEMGSEVRAKYEPRILGTWIDDAGEVHDPIGLGYMINGLTSLLADQTKAKNLGKRAQHDRLFCSFLPKLSLHWDKATPDQRERITTTLKKAVLNFPAELRDEIGAALRAAAKAEKA